MKERDSYYEDTDQDEGILIGIFEKLIVCGGVGVGGGERLTEFIWLTRVTSCEILRTQY
jgi:hypothetical protein